MTAQARSRDTTIARVAVGLGVVALTTFVILLAFFTWGGALGFVNDAGNALIGVLAASLAALRHRPGEATLGVLAAGTGGAIAVVGSWLVMTGTTGFVVAGFVSSVGFGLIGAWLGSLAWSTASDAWPPAVRRTGRAASALMAAGGLVAVAGVIGAYDSYESMPPWLWLFAISWIGTYLVLPAWAIGFGRVALRAEEPPWTS